jgi:hypothetical protein
LKPNDGKVFQGQLHLISETRKMEIAASRHARDVAKAELHGVIEIEKKRLTDDER